MANLLTPDTFEFIARYLLAGYVVIFVRSWFIVGVRARASDLLIEAVLFSLLVQLVVFFVTPVAEWVAGQFDYAIALPAQLALFLESLILPAIIGFLMGRSLAAGWNSSVLRRLAMPIVHPVRRAHDFAFGNNREPCFIILTYEDGTVIRGYFGEESLAASDDSRSDIYLERLYSEDDDGQWTNLTPARSGLLSLNGIRSVEFLDQEETEDGN